LLGSLDSTTHRLRIVCRHIPLNREAFETLQAWQKQITCEKEALVFASENGKPFNTVKKAWRSLRYDIGVVE